MHTTLALLAILPAIMVTGLMIWAAAGMAGSLREKRPIKAAHCVAVMGFLLAADFAVSLVVIVSAGLSHSEAAKARAPVYCFALFVLMVLLPALGIVLLYRRAQKP
jgi:hypothetical protein